MMLNEVMRMVSTQRNRTLPQFENWKDIDSWFSFHSSIIDEYWHFYLGHHNLFLSRWSDEDEGTFLKRVQDATIENHVAPIIDIIIAYLYGDPKLIKRYILKDESVDDLLTSTLRKRVWNHSKSSNLDDFKTLNTLVTGYTVIKREFCDVRSKQPFNLMTAKAQEISDFGFIKKTPLDSQYYVPLPYYSPEGECDPTRLGGILGITSYDNFVGNKTVMGLMARPRMKFSQIEYIDDQVWLKWRQKEGANEYTQVMTEYGNRNPYESVSIPFTVYRNTGDPFYIEGDSQVPAIKTLNMELNELANGDKETIRYHQNPLLVGRDGAKLPANFKRTKNAVVELDKKGAYFEYLTWEGKLEASQGRQEGIRRAVTNVTGVSLISRGFMKDIGQIRSGPPLKALFTSDRSLMARKFSQFTANEMEDMRADLAMIQFHQKALALTPTVDHTFCIEFNQDFLGIDKLLEEEINALQSTSGSISIEELVIEMHPDWTDEEVATEVKKIKDERKSKANLGNQSNQGPVRQSSDQKGIQQRGQNK